MRLAVIAEIIKDYRCVFGNFMADGAFAVEDSHGVALKPFAAGFAKFLFVAAEIFLKRLVIFCSAFRTADGVDFELDAFDLELVKNLADHCDHFSIRSGRSSADKFRTELMEFAESSCLGFFITEAAGEIACLHRKSTVEKSVLNKGAHASCGSLRTESDGALAFIEESVHLLLNNVGGIADTSCKEFGMFKGGEADFPETESFRNPHGSFFDVLPFCALFRKNVLGSPGCFCKNSHKNTSYIIWVIIIENSLKRGYFIENGLFKPFFNGEDRASRDRRAQEHE